MMSQACAGTNLENKQSSECHALVEKCREAARYLQKLTSFVFWIAETCMHGLGVVAFCIDLPCSDYDYTHHCNHSLLGLLCLFLVVQVSGITCAMCCTQTGPKSRRPHSILPISHLVCGCCQQQMSNGLFVTYKYQAEKSVRNFM